jgi:hypothetical protein
MVHIQVVVPLDETISHTCRHWYTSQNVLAICDFEMRFIFTLAGWPGSAHDSRILTHALANFSSFPVPPKGINGSFIIFNIETLVILFSLLTQFYRKILPHRLGLCKSNRVSCTLQRNHIPYTRISASRWTSSMKVREVQFPPLVPSKCHWEVFWSLEAKVAYFEEHPKFLTYFSEAYYHGLSCFA